MKFWEHVVLPCPPDKQDLLIGYLELLDLTGFVQSEDSVEIYVESKEWTPALAHSVRIAVKRVTRKRSRLQVTNVRDQNWNATWERSIKPVRATDRIIIKPSWKKVHKKRKNEILLRACVFSVCCTHPDKINFKTTLKIEGNYDDKRQH